MAHVGRVGLIVGVEELDTFRQAHVHQDRGLVPNLGCLDR